MGILKKWFGRAPEDIVARAPASRLEAMAKSSENKDIRCRAAERMNREEIWQYMALHDKENFISAMLSCKDLKFLEKLTELKPDRQYFISEHMDRLALPLVEKKVDACTDQEKLLDLAMHGKTDIPEYKYLYVKSKDRIRTKALYKIRNQEYLFQVAVNTWGDLAEHAIASITDPDLLVKVVLATEKETSRYTEKILSRLDDPDRLQYIAEHAADNHTVQLARRRIKEEKCSQLCRLGHDWVETDTDSDDDGDSPRFDYVFEKCRRCGVIRRTTYIARRYHSYDLYYNEVE